MEGRRIVYNDWNQVERTHASKLKKGLIGNIDRVESTHYAFERKSKMYKTLECRWCGLRFDEKRIYCIRCRCCQYCGMQMYGEHSCQVCGNRIKRYDNIKMNKYIIH